MFPDALDANRGGALSDTQARNFRALARANHKNNISTAALFLAGAVLIGFFASPNAPIVTRAVVTLICLAIAVILIFRAITGADALTRDLRRGRVDTAEGAIGKRRVSNGRAPATHYLQVGDASFKVALSTYTSIPDAGYLRVYFLPASRRVVNYERLPNPALPGEITRESMLAEAAAAFRSPTARERNEARAGLQAIGDAFKATVVSAADAPSAGSDTRPLGDAIVGTWKNAMATVTFAADGTVSANMFGVRKEGRWSVDASGHLVADLMGRQGTVDARVSGDDLTIVLDGQGMTFTRE
jgi:hypothetical protein